MQNNSIHAINTKYIHPYSKGKFNDSTPFGKSKLNNTITPFLKVNSGIH